MNIPTRTKEWNRIWTHDIALSSHKQTPAHFLQVPQTIYHLAMISEQSGLKTQKWNCIMLGLLLAILLFKPLTFILMDNGAVKGPCARGTE